MHHGGAFAHVGAQADTRSVSDTHAGRYHVVGHFRELVHREHFQQLATQAGFQLTFGQLIDVDGALAGPGHVRQLREHTGEAQAVRLDQAMGQQVQLEVGLRRGGQCSVFGQQGRDQRRVAFSQAAQQGGLGSVDAFECVSQLQGLGDGERNGLVTFGVPEDRRDGRDDFGRRVEQRLCVKHFQPSTLAVLSADAEAQAEQGIGHAVTSTKMEGWPT